MTPRACVWLGAIALGIAGQAAAAGDARATGPDVTVADVRPADPRGVVTVSSIDTSIRVVGWSRSEVSVRGSVGAGVNVELHVSGGRTRVRVVPAGLGPRGGDLEVRVPAASVVESRTVSGEISVSDVTGSVQAESISGKIAVTGAPSEVTARSTNGDVTVDAKTPQARARSVSGAVRLRNGRASAQAETVSGLVELAGGPFERVDLRSLSGSLTFDGSLAPRGSVDVRTHSGNVRMIVPASTSGEFEMRSHVGALTSHLGAERSSGGSLEFKAGSGGPVVRIRTFSGSAAVEVKK